MSHAANTVTWAPRWLQCTGKEAFSSPQFAAKVVKRWSKTKRRQGKRMSRPVQPYRCRHCGLFHIGGFGGK